MSGTHVGRLFRGGIVGAVALLLVVGLETPAFAAAPIINSFNPTSGPVGTSVTISGDHFTGVFSVTFNGVGAGFTPGGDNQMTATVPNGATNGPITVTNNDGSFTSSGNFTITSGSNMPTISSFSPTSGTVGTSVTINGSHFTGTTVVRFHGTNAGFSVNNDNKITATVPNGATTGTITVTNASGTGTSATNFTVTSGTSPIISSFSPTSGGAGTTVTINGSRFTGVNAVRFNGRSASFTFVSDSKVTAVAPNGVTTGRITLTTPSGTATSSSNFTVTGGPKINSFSPASGPSGTIVSISGSGFTGTTSVRFNGVGATFSVVNSTTISATVPGSATTGKISVTAPGGTATSSGTFTVTGGVHGRSVSLSLSGRLFASGHVSANDGYTACISNVPVVIKHLRHGSWRWMTTTSTKQNGDYRTFIRNRRGQYRAKAKKITLVNGAVCGGDRSGVVFHHRHR